MKWVFGRPDRLASLLARARRAEAYLARSACEVPRHSATWHHLHARLDVVRRRIRRLCLEARAARREARHAVTS